MTEPLSLTFEVSCSTEHAFAIWTSQIDSWWPADHTVTGRGDAEVVLDARLGGRIYERVPDGTEYDWGEVTLCEPPHRLRYLWHLRRDRVDATDVEIRFVPAGSHRSPRSSRSSTGAERGSAGTPTSGGTANRMGWTTLLPHFATPPSRSEAQPPPSWRSRGMPAGTRDDPWSLTTAPGTSAYTMWADGGYRGRFGMSIPPLLEALGRVELTHQPRNNRVVR